MAEEKESGKCPEVQDPNCDASSQDMRPITTENTSLHQDIGNNIGEKEKNQPEIDEELNDLLDSALKDFKSPDVKPKKCTTQSNESKKASTAAAAGDSSDPLSDMFTEEFSEEMAKQFEESMKNMMGNDPTLMQHIEMLANSASSAGDSPEAQQEFAATLSQTLSSLAQNSEGLEEEMSEEDLMKAFTSMGIEEGQEGFMPMMQGMMKTLLSKDVLYPSLKEMEQKYPKWLEENKSSTDKQTYDKYQQQFSIIKDICTEFEKEKLSESDDTKKLRFEKIVDLMQKMQELGNPPKEIVGDMAPGLEFNEDGTPKFAGMPPGGDQCCVM